MFNNNYAGVQVVAEETLQFLHHNNQCQPLFLHGFSIGGYMWGEICVKMKQDMDRYQHILDRYFIAVEHESYADVVGKLEIYYLSGIR